MLKPYVFAVCEKVVIDSNGVASLISLFNQIEAQIPSGAQPIPANAVVPMSWFIFTSWEHEPEDAGKEFTEIVQILYPDNSLFQEHPYKFKPESGKTHYQVNLGVPGFPIGQEGAYQVKMRLEQDGNKLFESASIKIIVKRQDTSPAPVKS